MDPNQQQNTPQGPGGRRLHIAHRRSPSEMTPLMSTFAPFIYANDTEQHLYPYSNPYTMTPCLPTYSPIVEQLALAQQIEMLQQQQQQIAATHQQYVNMGMIPQATTIAHSVPAAAGPDAESERLAQSKTNSNISNSRWDSRMGTTAANRHS